MYLQTVCVDHFFRQVFIYNKKPENCSCTRLEPVLRQFRYLSFYTGMLNGRIRSKSTIVSTSSTKGNMSTGTAFFMR